jgi:hypothetical protein
LHCLSRKDSVAGPKYGLLIAITLSEIALILHLVPHAIMHMQMRF